jgi:YHS domain-containing protein
MLGLAGCSAFLCPQVLADQAEPIEGIEGYCPVSYFTDGEPVKGKESLAHDHMGFRYYLSSEAALEQFKKDPGGYVPQHAGLCTTALGGSYGNRFYSDPTVYYVRDGKLYLFSSMRARNAFDRDPPRYIKNCADRFTAYSGYCPVAYQRRGKAVKGNETFMVSYRFQGLAFEDKEAMDAFMKDPGRYQPQYDGYCASALSRGQKHIGDPKSFAVIDKKTYLFWDDAARDKFVAEAEAKIPLADEQWSTLGGGGGVRVGPASKARGPSPIKKP